VSEPPPGAELPAPRRRTIDLRPLRVSPPFARMWIGSVVQGVGAWVTTVAVGIHIYQLTGSTFLVGLVGTVSLVPMIVAGLWGGVLADHFDRRRVLLSSSLVGWLSTLGLVALAWIEQAGAELPVWPLYVFTTINAVAATISGTTRGTVGPRLLPRELIPSAAALNGIAVGLQLTLGPAIAGVLAASVGIPWTYMLDAVLFLAGFAGVWSLPPLPPLVAQRSSVGRALLEGGAFLARAPNIRAGFLIDIVAMTLGRPNAIFPAIGALAFGGGAVTVGALTASVAIGTFLASLFSGPVAGVRRHGIAIGGAVIVYGAFTLLFGAAVALAMTGWFGPASEGNVLWLPLVLGVIVMAGTGASDQVSSIFRQAMLMTAAPDEMRGRLQGVFTVVVTGGPRLGDLYAGVFATVVALWFPPLLGGLLIMGIVATVLRVQRGFRDYDALAPTP